MHFQCPNCRQTLENNDAYAGVQVACPFCTFPFIMPGNNLVPNYPPMVQAPPQYPTQYPQQQPNTQIVYIQGPMGSTYVPDKKSAGVAALLSFFYFGLGQVYNGQLIKGIGLMVVAPITFAFYLAFSNALISKTQNQKVAMTLVVFLLIASFILWVWNVYDAYSEAEKINQKHRIKYGSR